MEVSQYVVHLVDLLAICYLYNDFNCTITILLGILCQPMYEWSLPQLFSYAQILYLEHSFIILLVYMGHMHNAELLIFNKINSLSLIYISISTM